MTKKSKHIHKLFRVNGKNNKMFKCAFPDCVFLLHHGQFEILIGRYSICNKCENKFIMNELHLELDIPVCDDCRLGQVLGLNRSTDEVTINDLDDFLSIKGID